MKNVWFFTLAIFATLTCQESLSAAAAAAAATPERKIETDAELNAAFARQKISVRAGLAPLALGGHGPLNIVFAYLQWDKSRPDMVSENHSSDHRTEREYVMGNEGQGAFSHTCHTIQFHSGLINHPSGLVYFSPLMIRNVSRLQDGRLATLLTHETNNQPHLMTLCPRTHVTVHSPTIPTRFELGHMRQYRDHLIMIMYNTTVFDINHRRPPYVLTHEPGDWLSSIKQIDDQTLLMKFKAPGNRRFIQRYDALTLMPIGKRLEIEGNTLRVEPPHIALLGDKDLLVQNENSSQVIDFETGVIIHSKIPTMRKGNILHILILCLKNNPADKHKGILIADNRGRIGHLEIGKKDMSFAMLPNPKQTKETDNNKLQQLSDDQVAQLTDHHLTIWSIGSKTRLAHFLKEFLYHRSIPDTENRFMKFHKGSITVADSAGNVARLAPESDVEMTYNGRRPQTIKPSGAPAMKPTLPIIRDAIPAKKI